MNSTLTEDGFYKVLTTMLCTRLLVYGMKDDVVSPFAVMVEQNRHIKDGARDGRKTRRELFILLCVSASPQAASFSPPEEERLWKLAQDVCLLRTAQDRYNTLSLGAILQKLKNEFKSMLKWREVCIETLKIYERHCTPPEHPAKVMAPQQCWHDLRELKLPDGFIRFAWMMEDLLRLAAQSQDENDPCWVAANKVLAKLQGHEKPTDLLDRQLASVEA